MNICFELFKLETFEYLAMSPEFQFYLSSQSNILLNERFFFKNVKGLNSRGATGKLSAIVHDKCGYFWGSEEEVIHGTINTGSLAVSDHVDSSDGDSAVSERTHSELEIGS